MADVTLAEFLADRLGEDEAIAARATPGPWEACLTAHGRCEGDGEVWAYRIGRHVVEGPLGGGDQKFHDAWHAARWDPARVLAEVAAKRRIVASYTAALVEYDGDGRAYDYESTVGRERTSVLERAVRDLASAYSGHDDYRAEWAPDAR